MRWREGGQWKGERGKGAEGGGGKVVYEARACFAVYCS